MLAPGRRGRRSPRIASACLTIASSARLEACSGSSIDRALVKPIFAPRKVRPPAFYGYGGVRSIQLTVDTYGQLFRGESGGDGSVG
jgi:hypothetical protein